MKYYWKQIRWDKYRLVGGTEIKDFPNYESLYNYCQKNKIDAQVA